MGNFRLQFFEQIVLFSIDFLPCTRTLGGETSVFSPVSFSKIYSKVLSSFSIVNGLR